MTGKALENVENIGSSIHGINYLVQRSSLPERAFWAVSLVIVSFGFAFLSFEIIDKFFSGKTSMRISKQQFPISEVPFPTFTVCPELIYDASRDNLSDYVHEMLGFHTNLESLNYNTEVFISDLKKQSQFEWIKSGVYARWQGQYGLALNPILTAHGFCFAFNMQPAKSLFYLDKVSKDFDYTNEIKTHPYPGAALVNKDAKPWNSTGDDFELGMTFHYDFGPNYFASNPFQPLDSLVIIVHNTDELPTESSQRFYLEPLKGTYFTITPEIFSIADELKTWPVEDRDCYLPEEKKLEYFRIYTKNNCKQECLSNAAYRTCGCVPFYLIRGPLQNICGLDQQRCFKSVELILENSIETECGCLDLCEKIQYNAVFEAYSSSQTFFSAKLVNAIYPLIRQTHFGIADFFGSIGGLMGLFAGISVISIIEVTLHIISAAVKRIKKKIQRNKVHVVHSTQETLPKIMLTAIVNREHVLYQCSKFFYKFVNRSDVHGLHYITDKNKKLVERIFWAIVVLISTIFCSMVIFDITRNSEMNPIEFGIDEKLWSREDIPFPAVVFCPDQNIQKYREARKCVYQKDCKNLHDPVLKEIFKDEELGRQELEPMTQVCNEGTSPKKTMLVAPILPKFRHFDRTFMIENQSFCFSNQKRIEFVEALTQFGVCYRFNFDQDIFNLETASSDYTEVKKYFAHCRSKEIIRLSQTLNIDLQIPIRRHGYCSRRIGTITVRNPLEFEYTPRITLDTLVLIKFIVRPVITSTDEALRKYSPQQRNCLFSDESHLKYFKKYSVLSCIDECRSNFTLEVCNCVPIAVIRGENDRICGLDDGACEDKIYFLTQRSNSAALKSCNCLPECNNVRYKYTMVKVPFVPENITDQEYAASASIYLTDDEFTAFRRIESYGTVQLLSNIGGFLGLFLGVSVLSLVEFVYFFTLRFFDDLWYNPNRR